MRALCHRVSGLTAYDLRGTSTWRSLTRLMKHALITAIIALALAIRHFCDATVCRHYFRDQNVSIFTNPENVRLETSHRIAR